MSSKPNIAITNIPMENNNTIFIVKLKKQLMMLEDAFYDGISILLLQHPDLCTFSSTMNIIINNINQLLDKEHQSYIPTIHTNNNTNTTTNTSQNINIETNINYSQLEKLGISPKTN